MLLLRRALYVLLALLGKLVLLWVLLRKVLALTVHLENPEPMNKQTKPVQIAVQGNLLANKTQAAKAVLLVSLQQQLGRPRATIVRLAQDPSRMPLLVQHVKRGKSQLEVQNV